MDAVTGGEGQSILSMSKKSFCPCWTDPQYTRHAAFLKEGGVPFW